MLDVYVKYFDSNMPRLDKIAVGDWVDLYVYDIPRASIKDGDQDGTFWVVFPDQFLFIRLGIAMELPSGYEAWVLPRGSLFKKKGLILTNSMGIIDNSYKGDNDEWMAPVLSCRRRKIYQYERLFQFRITENMPKVRFNEVDYLDNKDRSGFGSTG